MVPEETGIGQCGNRTDVCRSVVIVETGRDLGGNSRDRDRSVETGTGQCGDSRQVQVGMVTGQCGNSRGWCRSKW